MSSVLASVLLLVCAFFFHLLWWRVAVPTLQLKALFFVFLIAWCFALLVAWFSGWRFVSFADGHTVVGFLYFCLFYWVAALCYVITYSAMEGDSPTLSLARYLHRKGDKGVCHEEIEEFFRERPFIGARVRALVTDRILIEESNGYRLRSGKYLFFHTILLYRRIIFGAVGLGG